MFKNVKNPQWLCLEGVSLQLTVSVNGYKDIPYVINAGGTTEEEKKLWDNAVTGRYGKIQPVPKVSKEAEIHQKQQEIIAAKDEVIRLYEEGVLFGTDNAKDLAEARALYAKLLNEGEMLASNIS